MTSDQNKQFFTYIFDKETKGLTPEFWQELKNPFMSDPTLLIQMTEISGKNYQSQTNVQNIMEAKIAEDKDYAKILEAWLEKIVIANKVQEETEEDSDDEDEEDDNENEDEEDESEDEEDEDDNSDKEEVKKAQPKK